MPPEPQPPGDRPRAKRRRQRPPIGSSPGTLRADPQAPKPQLSVLAYGPDGVEERRAVALEDLPGLRRDWPMLWLNVDGFGDVDVLQRIGEMFGLHRLALEDVLNLYQRAKVEDYGTHQFVVLRMVDAGNLRDTEQLGMFVGPGFVITCQEHAGDCFDQIRHRLLDPKGTIRTRGSDYLAYALLDAVVDAYFPVLELEDERIERVEERIMGGTADAEVVQELYALRRHLLVLRRALWPLRDATSLLARGEVPHFGADVRPYLRDVHDHVVQLLDLLENYRDMGASLMEVHLSSSNNRLNEVMKLLTVISTIFIPLTFIGGVYGMNFDVMPELRWRWGYPAVLVVMVAVAGSMLVWFRRRRWL
jgi:magnesium transporter